MELKKVKLSDLTPYENNPRLIADAVPAVIESMEQVGYVTPIVVDENLLILAGHTRYKALCDRGVEEEEVVVVNGLTEEQKRKFRLLDNKTAEIAEWDYDKLKEELDGLDFGNFDYWDRELDKIGELADEPEDSTPKVEMPKLIRCPRCGRIVVGMSALEQTLDEIYEKSTRDSDGKENS